MARGKAGARLQVASEAATGSEVLKLRLKGQCFRKLELRSSSFGEFIRPSSLSGPGRAGANRGVVNVHSTSETDNRTICKLYSVK